MGTGGIFLPRLVSDLIHAQSVSDQRLRENVVRNSRFGVSPGRLSHTD